MVRSPVRKSGGAGSLNAVKRFLRNSGGDPAQVSAELKELVRRLERIKAKTGKQVALSPFVVSLLQKAGSVGSVEGRLHPARA
jgi:hypothetical protein